MDSILGDAFPSIKGYIWGQFALLTGACWIAYYYTRFATPPEDVTDARNGVVALGVFLVALLAGDIEQRTRKIEFIDSLEKLCSDVPDGKEAVSEMCDELQGLIDDVDRPDEYEDWIAGT